MSVQGYVPVATHSMFPDPSYNNPNTSSSQRRASTTSYASGSFRNFCVENPWEVLHTAPTFYVVLGAMAFTMTNTFILQRHILSTKDQVGLFLMGSYVVFASYFMIHYFLENMSTSFRKVSSEKKFYTISNLIKAGVLAAITPFGVYELYNIVFLDVWHSDALRNLGCIYAIPDFVSLLIVRRMSATTIIHHICVCIFNYFSVNNDYQNENVCRLIVVYAAFSTFAYSVNMLLASRFLGLSTKTARILATVSLLVYVSCCIINWSWQVYYIRRLVEVNNHWSIYAYTVLILFVMWDDVILNRWLLQNLR
eukprot:PhF_6_TR11709/c0_g1_i2/m.19050